MAEFVDGGPLVHGIGLGDARRLVQALDVHLVAELDLGLVHRAADRRGAGRLRRGADRDVALAGEQAGSGVEANPAAAGQVDLAPGVQVGEVVVGAGGAVERLHVRRELDQVAGDETRGQAQVAQDLHQQPAGVAAGAGAVFERHFRGLHPRFHADQVADVALQALVEAHQEVDGAHLVQRDAVQVLLQQGAGRGRAQVGLELFLRFLGVGEGELLGLALDEEIEGIPDRHIGDQVHHHLEFGDFIRKNHPRQPVAEGVLLPVDEVVFRLDLERIGQHRGTGVRRRAQADDLRRQGDAPVVAVDRLVVQDGVNAHRGPLAIILTLRWLRICVQARREERSVLNVRKRRATPHGRKSGANPPGRGLFSCIAASLVPYVLQVHHVTRSLHCTKINPVAAPK